MDGRGVDHQCCLRVAEGEGYVVGVVSEGDFYPLLFEGAGQFGGCTVISGYFAAFGEEVSFEGGHSYATCACEINVGFHCKNI